MTWGKMYQAMQLLWVLALNTVLYRTWFDLSHGLDPSGSWVLPRPWFALVLVSVLSCGQQPSSDAYVSITSPMEISLLTVVVAQSSSNWLKNYMTEQLREDFRRKLRKWCSTHFVPPIVSSLLAGRCVMFSVWRPQLFIIVLLTLKS